MAVTNPTFIGQPAFIDCAGGGAMLIATVDMALTNAAVSSFDASFMSAIGAPQGQVVGVAFATGTNDMDDSATGQGCLPVVDFVGQSLIWRNTVSGAMGATPVSQANLVLTMTVAI